MKTERLNEQDQLLLKKTGNIVSRRQHIPSTPRDTMAVLMQAAEQRHEVRAQGIFSPLFARWAVSLATVALLAFTGMYFFSLSSQQQLKTVSEVEISVDAGIDVAEWDLEIDTLMNEFDHSLASLSDDYVMNN
jgi:hypothetical protein